MDAPPIPPEQPPISQQPPLQPADINARTWAMWCHLAALAGYLFPCGNIIGPLIVWQMKRHEIPSIDEHGREAVNFQISVLIYLAGATIAAFVSCAGIVLFPLIIAAAIAALVLSIIAGLKANDGILYRYPLNLRLIKP